MSFLERPPSEARVIATGNWSFCRCKVARPLENKEIRKIVSELLEEWEVFVNNSESVLHSLEVEERFKTSFWDALILHAALQSAARTLYTEDLSDGHTYGTVRVVNPFKLWPWRRIKPDSVIPKDRSVKNLQV